MINLLMVGDAIGDPGRKTLRRLLPRLQEEYTPALTVVNAENSAGGFGLTPETARELFFMGVDVLTTGNHVWDKKEIIDFLPREPRLLRPANYPEGVPGSGWGIFTGKNTDIKIGVLNLEGRVFMKPLEDPFRLGRDLLIRQRPQTPLWLVDFHAEVTSEKRALGFHLDGLATAVIGTHTHVQTADEEILPLGTAYLTDVGMTGSRDSIIGVEKEAVIRRFLTQMPSKFKPAEGSMRLNAVVIQADPATGKALSIRRLQISD